MSTYTDLSRFFIGANIALTKFNDALAASIEAWKDQS